MNFQCRAMRAIDAKHLAKELGEKQMKIDKASNLFERTEAITSQIRGKRNLTQQDTATIALLVVLNEVADSGKSIEDLLDTGGKEWRIKIRDQIRPLFTASKNYQNTVCVEMDLMPKATGTESVEEFV
jgi:hypothetical protein